MPIALQWILKYILKHKILKDGLYGVQKTVYFIAYGKMCSFRQTVKTDMNSTTLEMARTSADTFAETIVGAVTAPSWYFPSTSWSLFQSSSLHDPSAATHVGRPWNSVLLRLLFYFTKTQTDNNNYHAIRPFVWATHFCSQLFTG